VILEFDRALLRTEYHGNIKAMQQAGDFLDWTPARIKGAFNFGQGTEKHLKEYIKNNRQYAIFKEV
jgi:hypothetical protein